VPHPARVRAPVGAEPGRAVGRGAAAPATPVADQRGVPEALARGVREGGAPDPGLRRRRPHLAAGPAQQGDDRGRAGQPAGSAGRARMTAPASRDALQPPGPAFLDALVQAVGSGGVTTDPVEIDKFLKDNSWLSPILTDYFGRQRAEAGGLPGVEVAVSPRDVGQLREAIAVAVRHGVPITPRGAGTSNFGQSIPLSGGMLLDLTQLNRLLEVTDTSVTAEAGALVGDLESAARAAGKELTLLTTTYATATIGGWVAGGHVGIGTSAYGAIWDGNVLAVKL